MKISDYLNPRLIFFLGAPDRNSAMDTMIQHLDEERKLPSKEAFRKAIYHREEVASTGIGMGVALPHAKLKEFSDFFIAIGIQKKKGIEWNALDKAPVCLIFMIGGPEDKQTEYLQILSLLTSTIREPLVRKKLVNAETAEEVLDLFSEFTQDA